jgi:DNA-binding transcriptional LysR family regulator
MDLRHLQYFVTVAEEMNITKAAERLGMAQPPLTRIIHGLEEELGVQLFDRSMRQITLTPAGNVFLERVSLMLTQYQEAVQLTQQISRGEKGRLCIGFTGAAIYSILPDIVRVYSERFPDTEIVLRDLSLLSQRARMQALHEHHIDIAFLSAPPAEQGISREQVFECPLVVILPITHPLTREVAVPLEALAEEAWIWSPRRKHARVCNQILHFCQRAGFEPRIVQTVNQFHAGVSLVASGVGIMVAEGWTRGQQLMRDRVAYRPLKDVTWRVDLQMLWRANEKTSLLEAFLRVAREVSTHIANEDRTSKVSPHA